MTDPIVYDEWICDGTTLKMGWDGTSEDYPLRASPGLHGKQNDSDQLTGAFPGAVATPQWTKSQQFTTETEVRAADDAAWRTARDVFLARTSSTAEGTYVVHDAGEVRTRFARVVARNVDRDSEGEVFHNAMASITFEQTDPATYGDAITVTLNSDSPVVMDDDGLGSWVPSERWVWTVPGPVTDPALTSDRGTTAMVRYVGDIASGYTLIVELLPKGSIPGYYAKIVPNADVANYRTFGVGVNAYPDMDGGTGLPPAWFPVAHGDTIEWTTSWWDDSATLVWRPGFD